MTLKTVMMSAAAVALIAGGAKAGDDATMTEAKEAKAVEASTADTAPDTDAYEQAEFENTDEVKEPIDAGENLTDVEFNSLDQMTVGDVIGLDVTDPNYAEIGEIDYVVPNGDSADAVIGIGGFLGLGEYTVALPLDEFQWDPEQGFLIVDTNKEALEQTPEFDESDAESLPDETPIANLMQDKDETQQSSVESDGTVDGVQNDAADTASSDAVNADLATEVALSQGSDADEMGSEDAAATDMKMDEASDDAEAKIEDAEPKSEQTSTLETAETDGNES